jgi:hypothetical protein
VHQVVAALGQQSFQAIPGPVGRPMSSRLFVSHAITSSAPKDDD